MPVCSIQGIHEIKQSIFNAIDNTTGRLSNRARTGKDGRQCKRRDCGRHDGVRIVLPDLGSNRVRKDMEEWLQGICQLSAGGFQYKVRSC